MSNKETVKIRFINRYAKPVGRNPPRRGFFSLVLPLVLLLFPEENPDRHVLETEALPQAVGKIALMGEMNIRGVADEKDKRRGLHGHLGDVVERIGLQMGLGRRILFEEIAHGPVQLPRVDPLRGFCVDLLD